jgi:rSAM/selenodomain-associated transferase 1
MIVILAKAPEPGRVKTRLIPALGAERAAALCHAMTDDVIATVQSLGVPWRLAVEGDPHPWGEHPVEAQAPGDLGARLRHALRNGGVALGTDAPTLTAPYIRRAFAELAHADVVFGPAADGGYVLVGIHPGALAVFDDIPWSTAETLAVSVERARGLGLRVALLDLWYDVDSPEDLTFLRNQLRILGPEVAVRTRSALG